jgi:general secretion pathway protein N
VAVDRFRGVLPPPAEWSAPTWLLLGAAGWSVGLLLVALAGAAGEIPRHPDDLALAPALPASGDAGGARAALAAPEAYAAIGARPLFSPERRPDPVGGGDGEAPVAVLEQDLVALVATSGVRVAVMRERVEPFRHHRVREGQPLPAAPGWRLLALEDRAVRLLGPEGERRLALRAFNGEGGEKPTPITSEAEAQAAAEGGPIPDSPSGALTQRFTRGTPVPEAPPPGAPGQPPAPADAPAEPDPEQLAEAIRRRIEARREQLRREAAQRSAEER